MSTEPYSIETTINHYLPPPENIPTPVYYVGTAGSRRRKYDGRRREVMNLRGREKEFNLDRNGFQLVKAPINLEDSIYDEEDKVKQFLYPEVEEIMKNVTGCTSTHIFSHIIRRTSHADQLRLIQNVDDNETININSPAMFAHVDQSYTAAHKTLQNLDSHRDLSSSAAQIRSKAQKSHHWAIINLWRPLKPITREPLAVCDAQSVADSDLQEVTLRIPADYRNSPDADPIGYRPAETAIWQLKPNQKHKWYSAFHMQPGEALLIKCFDSREDGKTARRAPHSAIQTPMDQGPPRESVEVRCLVFWEKENRERARL